MTTHRWYLEITPRGQEAVDELPTSKERMAVFDALRELLEAEDPYFVPGVKKLVSAKFDGIRRQEAGNFRILFRTKSTERTVNEHTYKGTLQLIDVLRRNEKTYR